MTDSTIYIYLALPNTRYDSLYDHVVSLDSCVHVNEQSNAGIYKSVVERLLFWEDYYYEKSLDEIRRTVDQSFGREERTVVTITGAYLSLLPNTESYYCADRDTIPRRLADLFPGATVIVPIQNQYAFYYSYWLLLKQSPTYNKAYGFYDWMNFYTKRRGNNIQDALHAADFLTIYDAYMAAFDRVVLFPTEQGGQVSDAVLGKDAFLWASPSPIPQDNLFLTTHKGKYTQNQCLCFTELFGAGNLTLQRRLGIDLQQYAYPFADNAA